MHIDYSRSNGIEYASVCNSVRVGSKVTKSRLRYLGRVLDKEKGIYKNKEHGIYRYDLASDTILPLPPDFSVPSLPRKNVSRRRKTLGLSFGDVYLVTAFLEKSGLISLLDRIPCRNRDTFHSMLLFYVLRDQPISCAQTWWSLSYAKLLYPHAELQPQEIRKALEGIGNDKTREAFLDQYLRFLQSGKGQHLRKGKQTLADCILIDSTGLPNVSRLPCTALTTADGRFCDQVRLLYGVQQDTGLPLFYRCVPDENTDIFPVLEAVCTMEACGVQTKWALLDTGNNIHEVADALYSTGTPFVSRIGSVSQFYQDVLQQYRNSIYGSDNLIAHNKLLYHILDFPCGIGANRENSAYGYLCIDEAQRHVEQQRLIKEAACNGPVDAELANSLDEKGLFLLLASDHLGKDAILPLFYTRDQVEEMFEISPHTASNTPVFLQTEAAFQGHLLITFLAAVIRTFLIAALDSTGFSAMDAIATVRDLQCLVYEDRAEQSPTRYRM